MVTARDTRTVTQKLFSRKREVDNLPMLRGGQEITYPARRNPHSTGSLSAMLCKACIVALKGEVLSISRLEPPGAVMVQSASQSGTGIHKCSLARNRI